MKPLLLANENFPMPSIVLLREAGYNVLAVSDARKGITDSEVLSLAVAEGRWIVTFDRDYGELIFAKDSLVPSALLYFRLRSYRPEEPGYQLLELLREPSTFAGQFVVIEEDSLRRRPLPKR